jgi:hypothetical protein
VRGYLGAEHVGVQSGRDIPPALWLADETGKLSELSCCNLLHRQ